MGISVAAAALTTLFSCKKNETPDEKIYVEENQPQPTADLLEVTSGAKAVVLGADRSQYNASVVNRLKNTTGTICADAKIVVFTTGYAMNFSQGEVQALLEAYLGGAAFTFLNPVFPDMEDFKAKASAAIDCLVSGGGDLDVNAAQEFCRKMEEVKDLYDNNRLGATEAIAFRGNEMYVVCGLEEMADISDYNTSGFFSSGNGTLQEKDCTETDYVPTDYDHGKSADLLLDWMQEEGGDLLSGSGAALSDANQSIDKYITGQRISLQRTVGPSRALDRTLAYELVYTIYSAYDFDNGVDYYFIRLEPNFHCDGLGCRNGDRNWVNAHKVVRFDDGTTSGDSSSERTDMWYGPYMTKFDYEAEVLDEHGRAADGLTLLATSPHTDVSGTSGYTTGITGSLSGNLGFSSNGPSGGATAGIAFSESHSHSENSLKVYHKMENGIPNWRVEGIYPQCHIGFLSYYHDEVATFQKRDWQTEFTWTVSIPNPGKNHMFFLWAKDITEISELNYHIYDYELRVHPLQGSFFRLREPNHSNASYIMFCSDDNLQGVVKEQFSQIWQNQFTYYARNDQESAEGAKDMFDKVKVAVKGYAQTLKSKGFDGTYTFYLSRTGGGNLASFTLENGQIKE